MACEDHGKRKCFTFIWKLENASYCWQNIYDSIDSPLFAVGEIHETIWKLQLFPSIRRNTGIGLYLNREMDNKSMEIVKIDFELDILSSDDTALQSFKRKNLEVRIGEVIGKYNFASRNDVFMARRSVFLPQNTLTIRCMIWNSVGEMSNDVQCFACSRISVEKRSFLWSIENFSTLKSNENITYEIKSTDNGKNLMSLKLFLTGGWVCDETIRFKIIPNYQKIKMSTFQLSVVDASKNTVKCFQDEFWYLDPCGSKDFTLFSTKEALLEKRNEYLPDDVLSLWCECAFCFGSVQGEILKVDSDCIAFAKKKSDHRSLDTENEFPVPKCILLENLKSMLNNSCVSDVKLRTKSQTYPSHKFILSARSPVFKAMFSNDMKEKINECVDIEDINDDTVLRMLLYIYSAEVEELEWVSATELYMATDKYQILNLKEICSSYLKSKLCLNNACETLVLANLHHDENLKGFVQDFIMRHGEDIINSEEWKQLAETNLKLAYETTCLKFKK